MERPRLLVLNKQELVTEERLEEITQALRDASEGRPVMTVSAAMNTGLDALLTSVWDSLGI